MIYLAADHRGFALKEALEAYLQSTSRDVLDVGDTSFDPDDDYVDFAMRGATRIVEDPGIHRGIFICGSGHGMDIVANKYPGVRATLGFNIEAVKQSRTHDDSNVLVLAADWLTEDEAKRIVDAWLSEPFSGEERHLRRIGKITNLERQNFK